MTPLVGTTNPSTPVGDKSGGERRAARAAAFQVFTKHETRDTAIAWRAAQASANSEVFTKHESRNFCRPVTASLFTIVHDCSALFSKKILPLSQCPLYVRTGNTASLVFTNQEKRDTKHGFPCPCGDSEESNPKPDQQAFTKHGSRDTKHGFYASTRHETRITAFFRRRCAREAQSGTPARTAAPAARPLLSCALWRGIGRLGRGMGGRRPPHRRHGRLGFHQPRDTQRGFSLSLRRLQGEQPQARPTGFSRITKHETRITNHGLYAFVAAFLRVVARHRAAMVRHGRPPSPAPATRPVGFSPAARHATCFSPALRRLQGEQPQARPTGFSRITRHETRITAFMPFFPRFPTISRHFPLFFGTPPSPRNRCPRAVSRRFRRPRDF